MKPKQILDRLIENAINKLLTEAFMSPKLGKFAAELGKFKDYDGKGSKLLNGIAWDKIPDSEVKLERSGSEDLKKYLSNTNYLIIWFASEKKMIQYRPPTMRQIAYGGKNPDNSLYIQPGRIIITQGREFLKGYGEIQKRTPAKDNYDKPYDGKLSVLKLSTEMDANALIINVSALEKYSTTDLRATRAGNKSGATAMQKVSDILSKNQERYRTAIRDNKFKSKTASTDKLVSTNLEKLKKQIEVASKINFDDLVTYSKSKYDDNTNLDVPTVKQIDMTKLIELTKLYRDIVHQYDRYLNYAKGNDDYYQREAESYKKELETMIGKIGA